MKEPRTEFACVTRLPGGKVLVSACNDLSLNGTWEPEYSPKANPVLYSLAVLAIAACTVWNPGGPAWFLSGALTAWALDSWQAVRWAGWPFK